MIIIIMIIIIMIIIVIIIIITITIIIKPDLFHVQYVRFYNHDNVNKTLESQN